MEKELNDMENRQLLAYAKDLAQIYEKEKEKRTKLEIVNQRLMATINGVKDALVTLDVDLNILKSNTMFLNLIGDPAELTEGKSIKEYLSPDSWDNLYKGLALLKTPDKVIVTPDRYRMQYYKIVRSPVADDRNRLQGFVLCFHDETQRKRNENLKEEFLGMVSHEIRTPLTAITGLAPFLEESLGERATDDDREYLSMMQESSDRLIKTIGELFDAASFSNRMDFKSDVTDLHDVLDEALAQAHSSLAQADISVKKNMGQFTPEFYGDREQMIKAIGYIIDNAIQYSDTGTTVTVTTSLDKDMWKVAIHDQGVGIPSAQIDYVFENFYQAEELNSRTHEGIGLGLSIVKKIVQAHKGNVELQSEPGQGACVIIRLPKYKKVETPAQHSEIKKLKTELAFHKEQTQQYANDLAQIYKNERQAVSTLQKTKNQLIRSDKLFTMGQLTAGIANEIHNTIFPLIFSMEILLKPNDYPDVDSAQILQRMHTQLWQAVNMLKQLLDFTKKEDQSLTRIEVVGHLKRSVQLLQFQLRKAKIKVIETFDTETAYVSANAGQLNQAFTNIINNAIDAMPAGGKLILSVQIDKVSAENDAASFVEIAFHDTGRGIAHKQFDRIFEPFFTTKPDEHGSGLGLFIAHQIIENHGGAIDLQSELGRGSAFTIRLQLIP
ncbi:ATP-binding protein [Desulfococcaceae bacterium HSG9]|nr:ATP-binding protein [Desulfococcaceae bacterium HSG9]